MGERNPCADCGAKVPLSGGRAIIRGAQVVIVCDEVCQPKLVTAPAAPSTAAARPRRDLTPWLRAAFSLVVVGFVSGPVPATISEAGRPMVLSEDPSFDTGREAEVLVRGIETPARSPLDVVWRNDRAVDVVWYHPLAGERQLPGRATRRFGAERTGTRAECGDGHCGVDLGGGKGSVVHAALPGRVERIVREADRKGGRYVKLVHDEGFATYYMHLDDIHPDLVVGLGVAAGEPVGTLGSSGVAHSEAHLHFQVSFVRDDGSEYFVDPEPMLEDAVLLEEAALW